MVRNGLSPTLVGSEHCEPKEGEEDQDDEDGMLKAGKGDDHDDSLECRDLCDKGIQDVDVTRLRGSWRTILLSIENIRCIALKENVTAYSDESDLNNRNEFWFDVQ